MKRNFKLDRRAFLKGTAGATLALPVLEAMGSEVLEVAPRRFCAIYTANGMSLPQAKHNIITVFDFRVRVDVMTTGLGRRFWGPEKGPRTKDFGPGLCVDEHFRRRKIFVLGISQNISSEMTLKNIILKICEDIFRVFRLRFI